MVRSPEAVSLKAKPTVTEAEFDAFASGLGDFVKRTDRLDIWARRVVPRNVAFIDPPGDDPSLEHYVAVVQWYAESNTDFRAARKDLPYSKTQAFTRMRRFMLGGAGPRGAVVPSTTSPRSVRGGPRSRCGTRLASWRSPCSPVARSTP